MGGLPPKPPIGGRVASPKPPAKVFCLGVRQMSAIDLFFRWVRELSVILVFSSVLVL
ncbi:hypothetical protein [Synechocystis sp. PCC 7509]|uniref:hypothetical protein n=1 Tax=Synechocystis sp. PCC 7509 TaxID=927677 RepID=UPI00130ECB96|nr:hypothetical protein [Synechocystis sp. PCC 7509]